MFAITISYVLRSTGRLSEKLDRRITFFNGSAAKSIKGKTNYAKELELNEIVSFSSIETFLHINSQHDIELTLIDVNNNSIVLNTNTFFCFCSLNSLSIRALEKTRVDIHYS